MKISDAHNDFLTEIKNEIDKDKYIKFLIKNNNIKNIGCVVWTTKIKNPLDFLTYVHNRYFVKSHKKLLFCIEDLGFINKNNFSIMTKKIIELKPFCCGIVWNSDNNLGGGAFGNKGLTNLGKIVIEKLEANNILIDTAHMNQKTFLQFTNVTTKPIYNSHCNLSYFKKHNRNINDNQIKTIITSNGFIGLSFVQSFISNNLVDSKLIAKQIAFFIQKYGENNVGIGSDFYGTKKLPYDIKTYNNLRNLKKALKKEGLNHRIINKFLYKNLNSFIKRYK